MSGVGRVVAFSVLRLLLFLVPFGLVWLLGGNLVVAAVVAAIAGVCLSVIFLPRQRAAMAGAVEQRAERRTARRRTDVRTATDEDVEDAVLDEPAADTPSPDAARRGDARS